MLVILWSMFALSTAHWAISLAFLIAKVKTQTIVNGLLRTGSDNMNAIVTINVRELEPLGYITNQFKSLFFASLV